MNPDDEVTVVRSLIGRLEVGDLASPRTAMLIGELLRLCVWHLRDQIG